MVDFVALVTPPILAGPDMKPANGEIFIRSTNTISKSGMVVEPFDAHGKIVDGTFKALDGGPLYLVVTPEGVALEIHAEIVQESPGGRRDKYRISRTVSTPNQSTVTWDALLDVVPVAEGGHYVRPTWAEALDAKAAEAIAASDVAVAAAASAEGSAAAAIAVGDSNDTIIAGRINTPGSATDAALTTKIVADAVPRELLSTIADIAAPNFTTELQARIDAMASAGGGIVEIPKGSVTVTATVTLKAGVAVHGRGKTATVITANGDFPVFQSATPLTRIDNVELANLRIYRIVPAAAATPIIDWTGIAHSELRHVSLDQPSSSRHTTVGVLFGAFSYYNKIDMVQIRGVNEGMKFQAEANANNMTNSTVLTSNYGYVVDNTNSLLFLGCAAEHVDTVGFVVRNNSKKNRIIGCRAEDIPVCFQVLSAGSPAFDNFIIASLAYERAGGTRYDIQGSNILIEEATQRYLTYLGRSYVRAYKSVSQAALTGGIWTKATFDIEVTDQVGEFASSTFTAALPGLYQFDASALWGAVAAGTHLEMSLYKNGVLASKIADMWTATASAHETSGGTVLKLAAGDTVEVWARTSASIGISSGGNDTFFTAVRIA